MSMYETTVRYAGGVAFEAESRGHKLMCDQPVGNAGLDAGMTPPELMLASIGTCAAYYAAQYLAARNMPADDLTIRVTAEKALHPARMDQFRIEVTAPGADDPKHREGLTRAVHKCLIHNTLMQPPTIEIVIDPVPSMA